MYRGTSAFLTSLLILGFAPMNAVRATSVPTIAWSDVAARSLPATVNIETSKVATEDANPDRRAQASSGQAAPGQRNEFFGSGFIVDPAGIIVTNNHVINGALSINVTLQDGTEMPARVLGKASFVDLALLKIDAGHPLPTLKLGDGDAVKPGDPVLAIGDPLGVGTSLSAGIISGIQRDLMDSPFDDYVQTDAAINQGNSGGPLVDSSGNVIGVNTTLLTNRANEGSNGVGFAISSNIVTIVLDRLLHPSPRPIGWIGVHLQGMMPDLARAMKISQPAVAIVTEVDSASPASEAGIESGDVILSFAGERPANARILMRNIAVTPIGASRELVIWSAGKMKTLDLQIRDWPGLNMQDKTSSKNSSCAPSPDPNLGLLLEPITPLARRLYDLGDASGLLVAAVDPLSEAYSRGFRPGIVIERINDQPVTTRTAARNVLREAAANGSLVAFLVQWQNGPSWFTLHTGAEQARIAKPENAETAAVCESGAAP